MSILGAVAIGAGVANAVGNVGNTLINQYNAEVTRQFNREEAEKNREFQKEMAQNNIKYSVQQAKELGISPSLILGDQTNSLGGSQASVGNPPPNNTSGLTTIANVLQEQYKLKTLEEMNEDKLQTLKDIQIMRMSNTANKKGMERNYTDNELKNLYSNINDVQI